MTPGGPPPEPGHAGQSGRETPPDDEEPARRLPSGRGAGWRERRSREVRDELADHVERRTAALIAEGYTPEAARSEALRRMGDMGRVEEECMKIARRRRVRTRTARWFDGLVRDVQVAVRTYARRPVLAGGVILTIMLAIGAGTSVFGIVRGVLLSPLPFPDGDRLYSVYTRYLPETGYDYEYFSISGPEYVDYRDLTNAMTGVAAYDVASVNMAPAAGEPERLRIVRATWNLFDILEVPAALGRTFQEGDGETAAPCVTVLGDGVWRERFGADPGALGRDLHLNQGPCTIVGVMPPGFAFPDERTRMYAVQRLDPTSPVWARESHPWAAVGRLAPDASPDAAQAELEALRARWAAEYPEHHGRGHFVVLRPLVDDVVGEARTPLLLLLGAVGVLLLVVIVNVSGLMLAGGEARRREFAVRTALGVGRARLLRQLLTESVLLAVVGGTLGLLASEWMLRGLVTLYPGRLPRADEIQVGGSVVLVGVAVSVASGLLIGMLPALRLSAVRLSDVLRTMGRGGMPDGEGVGARRIFVVAQTALTFVLVLAASVLARSYAHMRSVDLGFEPARVLTFAAVAPEGRYPDASRGRDYFLRLEERLAAIPGVEAAGAVSDLPLRSGGAADDFLIEGQAPPAPGQPSWNARYQMATPNALPALGLMLVAGRWLEPTDVAGAPPVAVVNEATARAYFGADAVGRRLRYYGADSTWITVVGVVRDVRQLGVTADPPPAIYTSLVQAPRPVYAGRAMNLVVRFRGDPAAGAGAVRAAAAEVDPTIPVSQLATLDAVVTEAVGGSRFTTTLVSAFAGLALLLGALGVYGVLAHVVHLRTHEIGIRQALGADRRSILGRIVKEGVALVLAGTGLGLAAAVPLRRVAESLVFGIQPLDPVSVALAAAALLSVSLAACLLPALRAASIDPLEAMRQE